MTSELRLNEVTNKLDLILNPDDFNEATLLAIFLNQTGKIKPVQISSNSSGRILEARFNKEE